MAPRHWLLSLDSGDRTVWLLYWNVGVALHHASCAVEKEHDGISDELVFGSYSYLFQHHHSRHHIVL